MGKRQGMSPNCCYLVPWVKINEMDFLGFPGGSLVKNPPAIQETQE